jgi:glycosyltransferase involved in cell wall biosynthesis
MRDAIRSLLVDRERAEAMGRRAREVVTTQLNLDRYVEQLTALLRETAVERAG